MVTNLRIFVLATLATLILGGFIVALSIDEPAAAPSLAENSSSPGICGDVSGDGRVNTTDARLIQRCAVGDITCPPIELCDVSGDLECNTTDARLIQRFAVGNIPDITCPTRVSVPEVGYTIAYPPYLEQQTTAAGVTYFERRSTSGTPIDIIAIIPHDSSENETLNDFVAQRNTDIVARGCDALAGCALLTDPAPITIDGHNAFRFERVGLSEKVILVHAGHHILELATPESGELLNNMIDTLRLN